MKQDRESKVTDDQLSRPQSAESKALFEAALRKEQDRVRELGFNPYKPIIGSSAQGRSAVERVANGEVAPIMGGHSMQQPVSSLDRNLPGHPVPSVGQSGLSHRAGAFDEVLAEDKFHEEADDVNSELLRDVSAVEGLGEALALLSSHDDQELSAGAITTALKVMTNLSTGFNDEKVTWSFKKSSPWNLLCILIFFVYSVHSFTECEFPTRHSVQRLQPSWEALSLWSLPDSSSRLKTRQGKHILFTLCCLCQSLHF